MTERGDSTGCGAAQLKDCDVGSAGHIGSRQIQQQNSDRTVEDRLMEVLRQQTAAADDDRALRGTATELRWRRGRGEAQEEAGQHGEQKEKKTLYC